MNIRGKLKHTFWPNRHNSFHPYLLRAPVMAVLIIAVLTIQVAYAVDGHSGGEVLGVSDDVTQERLLELTNRERQEAGEDVLKPHPQLQQAATAKARDMIEREYWSHYGPEGRAPWSFITANGYRYRYAGENLAKDFATSSGVVKGWMQSPEHQNNLLSSDYEDIGLGIASGIMDGRQTTVVVALYAAPGNELTAASDMTSPSKNMVLPAVTTQSFIQPSAWLEAMPLPTQIASVIVLTVAMVYAAQHITVRRHHLLWDSHLHPRPLLQAAAMVAIILVMVYSNMGTVG